MNDDFVMDIILCIVIVIAVGYMIINAQIDSSKEYENYCNDKYGIGYWHTEVNGTAGLGLKYSCFYNDSFVSIRE